MPPELKPTPRVATMSHSSPDREAYNDDDEPVRSRARWTSPGPDHAGAGGVPRVIRTAAAASLSMGARAQPAGYSPKVSVGMAGAHSWAPYAATIGTLRSLSLMSLKGEPACAAARAAIAELYDRATPFHAARRFPAGEVYVCLDRAPLAQHMIRIQQYLIRAEADQFGEEFGNSCSNYVSGIGGALDVLTRVVDDDHRVAPALYDRAVFESAFLLAWTDQ